MKISAYLDICARRRLDLDQQVELPTIEHWIALVGYEAAAHAISTLLKEGGRYDD